MCAHNMFELHATSFMTVIVATHPAPNQGIAWVGFKAKLRLSRLQELGQAYQMCSVLVWDWSGLVWWAGLGLACVYFGLGLVCVLFGDGYGLHFGPTGTRKVSIKLY